MKREVVIGIVILLLIIVAFSVSVDDEASELTGEASSFRPEAGSNEQAAGDTLDRPAVEEVANQDPQININRWKFIGPGGGGRFEGPAISPHDSNFLLSSGDTGLNYKSLDNGETWKVMNLNHKPWKYSRYRSPFEFHPANENLIFFGKTEGFFRSDDKGETWRAIEGPWDDINYVHPDPKMRWRNLDFGPMVVEFSRYDTNLGLAAFDDYQQFDRLKLFITENGGTSWSPLDWNPEISSEKIKGIVFDETNLNRFFIATDKNFYISWNKGANIWKRDKSFGDIVAFGGVSRRGANTACDRTRLLAVTVAKEIYNYNTCNGAFEQVGNFGSRVAKVNQIEVSHSSPNVAYASVSGVQRYPYDYSDPKSLGGLYKTEDGGASWRPVLFRHPLMSGYNIDRTWRTNGEVWGWHLEARGISVSDGEPHKIFISDSVSNDEGANWKRIDSDSDNQDRAIAGEGMPIMGSWDLLVDGNNQYIAMTDFSTWTSSDNGETWKYHTRDVNGHLTAKNIYKNIKIGNKIIGFGSEIHDLPSWSFLAKNKLGYNGRGTGVMQISLDNGNSWETFAPGVPGYDVTSKGLVSVPFTDAIVLDDESILVAALGKFGGFYKSVDGGDSFEPYKFEPYNNGIPGYDDTDLNVDREQEEYNEDTGELTNVYGNRYGYRLGKTPQGKIYGVVTVRISHPGYFPGEIYFLNEGVWEPVLGYPALQNNIPYPVDFIVNPNNPNDMLIATFSTVTEPKVSGGLWRSTNAGRNWGKIYDEADVYSALFDNGRIIMSVWLEGLKYTDDGGLSWNDVPGLPISSPSKLIVDGDNLIVTGHAQGLWKSY